MAVLVHPTYFPNIAHFIAIVNAKKVVFEVHDHYQKQTYRNRTNIFGANGKLGLSIPVHHSQHQRQLYSEVQIANDGKWQAEHWKSILSAYSTSPFFEFYKDELEPLFQEGATNLMAFNFKCLQVVSVCLQMDFTYEKSEGFEKQPDGVVDLRHLVKAKGEFKVNNSRYVQVFGHKHGFINNLSLLDLLFNEGPNSINYLQQQSLEILKAD